MILFATLLAALPAARAATFDEALGRIVDRSTAVATQKARLDEVEARNLPTRLFLLPTVSVEAARSRAGDALAPPGAASSLRGVARLNLFRFGADLLALQAARSEEEAQRELLDDAVLSAEEGGAQALVESVRVRLETGVLAQIVRTQSESLRIARERYERGLLPLQEMEKVSVDLENARARLIDAEIRAVSARTGLIELLGNAEVEAAWPWKDLLGQPVLRAFVRNAKVVLASRPAYRAAQARLEAEERRVGRAWRLVAPSVDASFTYGYFAGADWSAGTNGWSGSVGISLPLFDQLSGYSAYRAQVHAREAAEVGVERERRSAERDWELARESFISALDSALARERTLSISRRIYRDSLKRLRIGRASANDLRVDESRLFDSELFAIQGWATAHLAYSRFCHAIGRRISRSSGPMDARCVMGGETR